MGKRDFIANTKNAHLGMERIGERLYMP